MYEVHFVGDDALLEGQDFLLVQTPEGGMVFYRASALTEETIADSWAAYRAVLGMGGLAPDPERVSPDRSVGTFVMDPVDREWVQTYLQLVS